MDGFNEKSTEQVQEQQPLGCLAASLKQSRLSLSED